MPYRIGGIEVVRVCHDADPYEPDQRRIGRRAKTQDAPTPPLTRVDFLHLSLKSRQGRQGDKEDKGEKLITSFK